MATAPRQFPMTENLVRRWSLGHVDVLCYDAQRTTVLTLPWEKNNVDHET
jgi:hypothetical protein